MRHARISRSRRFQWQLGVSHFTVVWLFTRSVYCIVKYFVKTTRLVISPQLKEAASSLKFGDYTERTLNLKSAIFPQSEKNIAKNGKTTTSER